MSVIYRPDGTPSVAKAVELFSAEQARNKLPTNKAAELRLAESRRLKALENKNKSMPYKQNGTTSAIKRSDNAPNTETKRTSANRRSAAIPSKSVKISTPQSLISMKTSKTATPQSAQCLSGRSRQAYSMDSSTVTDTPTLDRKSMGNTIMLSGRRMSELGSAKKIRLSSMYNGN